MKKKEIVELMDSHVTAYKRHYGIHDSHIECYERFQSSLHDTHCARHRQYLADTGNPSDLKDAAEEAVKAVIT